MLRKLRIIKQTRREFKLNMVTINTINIAFKTNNTHTLITGNLLLNYLNSPSMVFDKVNNGMSFVLHIAVHGISEVVNLLPN